MDLESLDVWVKAHYGDPLLGTFGCSIIVHIISLFQKHSTFNFGCQFWFVGPKKFTLQN